MQGTVINITRFCTDDGPGIRTTVFLKGCPLRCVWCHNPESQNPNIEYYISGEKIGEVMTPDKILEEIIKDKIFYELSSGGVTISGGEPLFQAEYTAEILKLCKQNKIHTAIETSGFGSQKNLKMVLQYCDFVLFDIKETNEENHLRFTGVTKEKVLTNLKITNDSGIPFLIRMPIIPSYNDRIEHFLKVKELKEKMDMCQGIEIMPYHKLGEHKYRQLGREYRCTNIEEPDKQQVENWKKLLDIR